MKTVKKTLFNKNSIVVEEYNNDKSYGDKCANNFKFD